MPPTRLLRLLRKMMLPGIIIISVSVSVSISVIALRYWFLSVNKGS